MRTLGHDEYLELRSGATVLEQDRHGAKVLRLSDGSYLKLFRRKRLISSAAWYPYAQRFANNASAPARLGIPCPNVMAVYRIPQAARDAVRYRPLAGRTLRQLASAGHAPDGLRARLGQFVARLVYFRSLHPGNIVLTPGNVLGLIDIADLRAGGRPLSRQRRWRNFRHLMRNAQDRGWLEADGDFAAAYRKAGRPWQ
ncbi:MAG TPA: toluene tolerance protein [Candidatus Desulfobacillus sp.]|nr:toluene tolerance protein [Candidatus Desulfobacillus sp.]